MRRIGLVGWLLWAGAQAAAFENHTPRQLCALMNTEGFRTPGWRESGRGLWRCQTPRKKLIQGEPPGLSSVRYRVEGREGRPQRLLLELRMEARRAPQAVLNRFARMVETLLAGLGLEGPAGLSSAIRSATPNEWHLAGYHLALQKRFSRGSTYELWFLIEPDQSISIPSGRKN